MEPGHEDREYLLRSVKRLDLVRPQWSPVMKTGNTCAEVESLQRMYEPQWSPVMKTGNTGLPVA